VIKEDTAQYRYLLSRVILVSTTIIINLTVCRRLFAILQSAVTTNKNNSYYIAWYAYGQTLESIRLYYYYFFIYTILNVWGESSQNNSNNKKMICQLNNYNNYTYLLMLWRRIARTWLSSGWVRSCRSCQGAVSTFSCSCDWPVALV